MYKYRFNKHKKIVIIDEIWVIILLNDTQQFILSVDLSLSYTQNLPKIVIPIFKIKYCVVFKVNSLEN